jgi:hypothetical protein
MSVQRSTFGLCALLLNLNFKFALILRVTENGGLHKLHRNTAQNLSNGFVNDHSRYLGNAELSYTGRCTVDTAVLLFLDHQQFLRPHRLSPL